MIELASDEGKQLILPTRYLHSRRHALLAFLMDEGVVILFWSMCRVYIQRTLVLFSVNDRSSTRMD
jgi:hypothetical protein